MVSKGGTRLEGGENIIVATLVANSGDDKHVPPEMVLEAQIARYSTSLAFGKEVLSDLQRQYGNLF